MKVPLAMAILRSLVARHRRGLGVGQDVEHGQDAEKQQETAPNPPTANGEHSDASAFISEHASAVFHGDEEDEPNDLLEVDRKLEEQTRLGGVPYMLDKVLERIHRPILAVWAFLFTHPDDMHEHIPVYRWLPIVSGIVIPFSILLEIPGLTEHWYVRTVNDQVVEIRRNSPFLDTGLGISMACAIVANVALMFRFLERHVKTMTVVTICGLTLHG